MLVLLLLILVTWGLVITLGQRSPASAGTVPSIPSTASAASGYSEIAYTPTEPIEIRHSISQNVNTYGGSVTLEVPCSALAAGIRAEGENPVHLVMLLNMVQDNGTCIDPTVGVSQSFSVSYTSDSFSSPVFDGILLNGKETRFTLVESGQ